MKWAAEPAQITQRRIFARFAPGNQRPYSKLGPYGAREGEAAFARSAPNGTLPAGMITVRRFPIWRSLLSSWRSIAVLSTYGALLTIAHVHWGLAWLKLPALPVSILGTAVSFYLGFKGNSAYDRLWEARKIWGGIVNTSRTWGIHVTGMVTAQASNQNQDELKAFHQLLIYRHIAWLGALRTQLRRIKKWEHTKPINDRFREQRGTLDQSPEKMQELISPFMDAKEVDWVMKRKNQATQILKLQSDSIKKAFDEGYIDDFRHMELAKLLETMFTLQGKCERIKNFPLPRQYATANHWFVLLFITMVPLALVGAFEASQVHRIWWTIPVTVIIGWVFIVWDQIVDYSENPFEGLFTDIPMNSLSRTIEIDMREMLDETDLPGPVALTPGEVMM